VGRGANLLINLTPDRSGLIPAADAARAREFGDEVRRRFGRSIAETRGSGDTAELKLERPTRVDHVILQEEIGRGERVREYVLEGLADGRWISLGTGTAIGQMRIQPFEPRTLDTLRLRCTQAVATPVIRRMAAFATNAVPPATWNSQVQLWAADAVGRWTNGQVDLDISKKIDAATQYRLRFVSEAGGSFHVGDAVVLLDGTSQPALLRPEKGRTDAFILTMPGIGQRVRIRAVIDGAKSGDILLQKL